MAGISITKQGVYWGYSGNIYTWEEITHSYGSQTSFGHSPHINKRHFDCALRADYNLTNARSLMSCGLTIKFTNNAPSDGAQVVCYLYTSDPYAGAEEQITAVPSGYIATSSTTIPANPGNGQMGTWDRSFSFSNLNLTHAGSLYFLFAATDNTGTYMSTFWIYNPYVSGSQYSNMYASISATFKGMPTSFSVSPSTVSTGGSANINIGNYWTSETVQFYYGSTLLGTSTITNGSGSVSIPKSWFTTAGITTSQTMTVQARLVGTSFTQNFTVQAGNDMKPVVGTPAVSIVQDPAASAFPNTYIANISKAKVRATVSAGSNAGISAVRVTWAGGTTTMSLVSGAYEATVGPLTGNTSFTVTATDIRGMTQQATYNLTGVVQYVPPVIAINESQTYRCNSSGTKQDGGVYVRARGKVTITTSGLSGNSLQSFRFYIQEEPNKGSALANDTQCSATAGRAADYYETLVFEARDKIQTVTRSIRLQPATRNFAMKRSADGTYIGIGVLPQHTSGESTVDIEEGGGYYEGGYLWGSLTRLNSYATDGSQFSKNFRNVDNSLLHAPQNAEAFFIKSSDSGWSNSPVSGSFSGLRKVIWIDGSHYFVIILEAAPTAGRIWISYNGGTWKSLG